MKIHATHPHETTFDCKQADKIEGIEKETNKIGGIERELGDLNKVVFRGNGKPSLVSRVEVLDSKLCILMWLVSVTCGAVAVQVVTLWFKR